MTTDRPWTDAELQQLHALKGEGLTHREIGARLDRTHKAVAHRFRLEAIKAKRLARTAEWREVLAELKERRKLIAQAYAEGGKIRAIKAQFGVAEDQIYLAIRENGVPMRKDTK